MSATSTIPLPPHELVRRVGWDIHSRSPAEVYEQRGREQWGLVKSLLGADWSFDGKHVLDFGCGAGRLLRHTLAVEAKVADIWGCDIDAASIEWMRGHMVPPLHVAQAQDWPPAPFSNGQFDLVFSFSVFTHLLYSWSAWLLELHRVLAPDGVAIITVFGPGISTHGDVPIGDDITGMNVLQPNQVRRGGAGPLIVHAEWWLRAHWGRIFEIRELQPGNPTGAPPLYGQSVLVMTRRPVECTREELELPEPGEPRELTAARYNVTTLAREAEALWHTVDTTVNSRSWRYTAPLRKLGRTVRAARHQR